MNKRLRFLGDNSCPFGIDGLGIKFASDWVNIIKTNDNKLWIYVSVQEVRTFDSKKQTCSSISRNIVDNGIIIHKNRFLLHGFIKDDGSTGKIGCWMCSYIVELKFEAKFIYKMNGWRFFKREVGACCFTLSLPGSN